MSINDQLPMNKLNDVNWDSVSEDQATNFGVVLGLFNDCIDAKEKLHTQLRDKLEFTLLVTFIAIIGWFLFNPVISILCCVTYAVISIIKTLLKIKETNLTIQESSKLLSDTIDNLPK